MTATLRTGDEVVLRVVWGSQERNKCPNCLRYLAKSDRVDCRCGAEYRRLPNGRYRVVREPA